MKRILSICLLLAACFVVGCEKKIPDIEPLIKYESLEEGKILFTNKATNAKTFEWDFGDNSEKSKEANPTHQYMKNGQYNVIFIAKNKRNEVVSTRMIDVKNAPKPIVKFSYKSLGNGTIEFINSSERADSHAWDFGDGGKSTEKNPKYQFLVNGTYEVKLTSTSVNGSTVGTQNITIADAPKPVADFGYNLLLNGEVNFYSKSQNASSHYWTFGNGSSSTEISPFARYYKNDTYTVTLTVKNKNGESTSVKQVTISNIYVPTTGRVMFWSQVPKSIKIYINNVYQGMNTKYMGSNTPPICGTDGFVTVTLPQGAYSFTAETDEFFSTKWAGTINVVNGQCGTMQLTKTN